MGVEADQLNEPAEIKKTLSGTDRVALSLALSQVSPVFLIAQGAFTAILTRELGPIPKNELEAITFGLLGIASIIGFLYEVDTLKRIGVVINPGTVVASLKLGSPELATLVGTLYGHLFFFLNFVDVGSTLASLSANENIHLFLTHLFSNLNMQLPAAFPGADRLFITNLLSRTIIGFSFSMLMNWTIRHGLSTAVLDKYHQFSDLLANKIIKNVSTAALSLDYAEGKLTLDELVGRLEDVK